MSPSIRDPWNPWTTSFAMTPVHPEPTGRRAGDTPTQVAAGLFALAWQRDERGTIERLPIEVVRLPSVRE